MKHVWRKKEREKMKEKRKNKQKDEDQQQYVQTDKIGWKNYKLLLEEKISDAPKVYIDA